MKKLTIAPRAGKRYFSLLKETVDVELPNELVTIIKSYGGLAVVEDKFIDFKGNEWELQKFDHIASIIDLTKEFKEKGWGSKVPFAYDPGGWHFCLSFDKETYGRIIVNRWTDHSPEEQFLVIADSFEEFINGLKRSDELS